MVDRPNIFALHEGYALNPAGRALKARIVTDIVANEAARRGQGVEAFALRLSQGVMETAKEPPHNRIPYRAASIPSRCRFRPQKIGWIKLTSPDEPSLAKIALSCDTIGGIVRGLE